MDVVEVRDLWKRYRRPPSEVPRRLRHLGEVRRARGGRRWALQDVSFTVPAGQSLALLGSNGSGKSSLLRILAGTSRQTRGQVVVREAPYGLLSLGEGMHPLMTGRENAVTGAMVAGLSHGAATAAVPAIADFAELGEVMDRPLRTYSEGMKLRLAFATSMVVEPRLLLVDEVLAVGDLRFRERCLERLRGLRAEGVTTVLVTHDLTQVRDLCDRAVWLADGRMVADGPAQEVVDQYELTMYAALRGGDAVPVPGAQHRSGTGEVSVTAVRLRSGGLLTHDLPAGSALTVEIDYESGGPDEAHVAVSLHDTEGRLALDVTTEHDRGPVTGLSGTGTLRLELERLDLAGGRYALDVGLYPPDWSRTYDHRSRVLDLEVHGTRSKALLSPPRRWSSERRA